ncbi:MAG TPA: hypothetical protein VGD97_03805 [Lacunisphaera sp.]
MCVLTEPVPPVPDAEQLLGLVFLQMPGTIARLDLGANLLVANCGRGRTLVALARQFPRSRFFGLETAVADRAAAQAAIRGAWLQNAWIEPDSGHLTALTGSFQVALRLPHPAGVPLPTLVSLLQDDALLFDLHPGAGGAGSHESAGLTLLRHARLPDGICTIARK